MQFDITLFLKSAAINTAVLLPFIMAIVTFAGKMGVSGKPQLVTSLVTGFVLGVLVQAATIGWPSDWVGWLALVIYGLVPGLTASGVYETGKELARKY